MSEPKQSIHGQWSSRLAFILAATGAAVGLGNIWKFPYMAGDYGGSAFVFVYLLCVLVIGIPAMIAEMMIGRRGLQNPINSLQKLATDAGRSKHWRLLGWWGAAILLLVLSFYSVVAGWSLAYLLHAISGDFAGQTPQGINHLWHQLLSNPKHLLYYHGAFMLMTLTVVACGVKAGIERASRIMMPMLLVTLLVLVGYATSTNGFMQALHYLLNPNFAVITPSIVIAAMGHAFFTLAIGAGAMLVYGSYLTPDTQLGKTVVIIALLDAVIALLAGFAIFPLLFSHGLVPQEGPGLMFKVLPIAFAHMQGGTFWASLFFLLLLFAAWTSSISLAEPLVVMLMERCNLARKTASLITGIFAWTLGIFSLLSFNAWQDIHLFGHWTFFSAITDLTTNIMLPIGGLGFTLFAGWFMLKPSMQELGTSNRSFYKTWLFAVRYLAPIGILIILVNALF